MKIKTSSVLSWSYDKTCSYDNTKWNNCLSKHWLDPATGKIIAEVKTGTVQDYEECVKVATDAYKTWSNIPAPRRGEIVRQIGDELRAHLEPLGKLVSLGTSHFQSVLQRDN